MSLNWEGHLPSSTLERSILRILDGADDDGLSLTPMRARSRFDTEPDAAAGSGGRLRLAGSGGGAVAGAGSHPAAFDGAGPKAVLRDSAEERKRLLLRRRAYLAMCREETRRATFSAPPVHCERSDDEEEEAFHAYALKRRREMLNPTCGTLAPLTADSFVEFVDGGGLEIYAIVHIFEPFVPACVHLNYRLQEMARSFEHVRFATITASESRSSLPPDQLPALVVYRGGEFVNGITRLHEILGEDADLHLLMELLVSMGVDFSSEGESAECPTLASDKEGNNVEKVARSTVSHMADLLGGG